MSETTNPQPKYCPYCGAELVKDACPSCGALSAPATPALAQQPSLPEWFVDAVLARLDLILKEVTRGPSIWERVGQLVYRWLRRKVHPPAEAKQRQTTSNENLFASLIKTLISTPFAAAKPVDDNYNKELFEMQKRFFEEQQKAEKARPRPAPSYGSKRPALVPAELLPSKVWTHGFPKARHYTTYTTTSPKNYLGFTTFVSTKGTSSTFKPPTKGFKGKKVLR